ncbi:MAG: hypothetical protein HZB16_21200 [Armatimonadetes bacterium]|nr:hypothetical protein [Armatimonadota bacterium]
MQLLRTKVWAWSDIALLKWCCLLLGMVIGAHFAEPVRQHAAALVLVALLLALRPSRAYWSGGQLT